MNELDLLLNELTEAAQHFMDLVNDLRSMFTTKEEPVEEEKTISFTELRRFVPTSPELDTQKRSRR